MKHFTSYYANLPKIPSNYMCIGISRYCPDWLKDTNIANFSFYRDNFLAPSEELLSAYKKGEVDIEEYKKIYITDLLTKVQTVMHMPDIPYWINELDRQYGQESSTSWDGVVFMCYEKPHEFCHRHLFRRLLTNVYKIPCEEYGCRPTEVWGEIQSVPVSRVLF